MPHVYYACCDVAEKVPHVEFGLKANCWVCGISVFTQPEGMDSNHPWCKFLWQGRMTRPTDAVPPWRV